MFKKELAVNDRLKIYGRQIIGIGIFHIILNVIEILILSHRLIDNLINLTINFVCILFFVLMIIGIVKKKKYGIICGWLLETLLIVSFFLSFQKSYGVIGITNYAEILCLPFALFGFSDALSDVGNNETKKNFVMPVLPILSITFSIDCISLWILATWYMSTFIQCNDYI